MSYYFAVRRVFLIREERKWEEEGGREGMEVEYIMDQTGNAVT